MALEDQLEALDLSGEPKRHQPENFQLSFGGYGAVKLTTKDSSLNLAEIEGPLQRLFDINKANNSTIESSNDIDAEIKALVEKVRNPLTNSKIVAENKDQNVELKQFSQTIALMAAHFAVHDFIRTEIDDSLIDKMMLVYIEILILLKNNVFRSSNFLLTRVSLISPLLITISFSYRMRSSASSSLVKILSLLFTYSIQNDDLLQTVLKLFTISSTTNIEMFEVFNKLWENTLETPTGAQLNDRQLPGPLSVTKRLEYLDDHEITSTLLNSIFPYPQNQYIRQLSRNTLKLHSILTNIKVGNKISKHLTELIGFTSDDCSLETLFVLLETLGLENTILDLFGESEFRAQLNYIFSKLSQVSALKKNKSFFAALQKAVYDKDHFSQLEISLNMRYKVLLETIDHNTTIDFQKESAWSISLFNAVSLIDDDFDLIKSHLALSDIGSSLSLSAVINHVSFTLADAILKSINPSREISSHLSQNVSFQRFPPLPKSDFLNYSTSLISQSQVNLGNVKRLFNSLHYCLSILSKINIGYNEKKEWVYPVQSIELEEDDLKFQAADKFLSLTYSSLFSILTVADELLQKSKRSIDIDLSPIFFDYASTSQTFKFQTFRAFENIFRLYDTFAFFKLIKLTMKISMSDLELQKLSIKVLNHLIFHSDNGLKSKVEKNEVIMRLLTQYISLWSDQSDEYIDLKAFLNISTGTSNEYVLFDTKYYLNLLGHDDSEILQSSSPATTTSAQSSSDGYSFSNNNTNGFKTNNVRNVNNAKNFSNINQPMTTQTTSTNNTITKAQLSQDNTYFNNQSLNNYNATAPFNNNNFNQFQNNTGPLSAGAMDHGYRTSNIRNIQSFVPQTYNGAQFQNNRTQSVHVDQFGNYE